MWLPLLFVAIPQVKGEFFLPPEFVEHQKLKILNCSYFSPNKDGTSRQSMRLGTKDKSFEVSVRVQVSPKPWDPNKEFRGEYSPHTVKAGTFSGVPMGDVVACSKDSSSVVEVIVFGKYERAVVMTNPLHKFVGGRPQPIDPNRNQKDDQRMCELIARRSIATFAALRVKPSGNGYVAGNTKMVDLQDWAAKKKVKVNFDPKLGSAKVKNKTFYLGAKQWKEGSNFRNAGDVTMLLNGKWLVPAESLS